MNYLTKDVPSDLKFKLEKEIEKYKDSEKSKKAQEEMKTVGRAMGLPDVLRNSKVTFARTFRWTFEPNGKEHSVTPFTKEAGFNLKTKEIEIHFYDVLIENQSPTAKWIDEMIYDKMVLENATFRFWDGCGNEICSYEFEDVRMSDHHVTLDYSKSDPMTHRCRLKFSNYKRTDTKPSESA